MSGLKNSGKGLVRDGIISAVYGWVNALKHKKKEEAMVCFNELVAGQKFIVPPQKQRGGHATWLLMKVRAFFPEPQEPVSLCDADGSHAWITRKVRCNAMRVENGMFCFVRASEKVIEVM